MRISLFLLSCWTAASVGEATTLREDFASAPAANGWRVFGDTNLFHWNPVNENLEVTWDSSQTNSYFHRPLGTVLTKSDDFGLAFDLRPSEIAVGVNPNKRSTFELAVGFLNFIDAASTNFERGIGVNSSYGPRNLAEFDYFPDSGLGATISPTMISSNNQFAAGFDFPLPAVWPRTAGTSTCSACWRAAAKGNAPLTRRAARCSLILADVGRLRPEILTVP